MDELKTQFDNEAKKEYLRSYRKALRREQDILEEIQQLRMDKMFPSLVSDGMPKGSSQSDLSDYMVHWDELMDRLKQERAAKMKLMDEIDKRIRVMKDEDEQRVLRLHYIKGLDWGQTAREMACGERNVHRIHSRALRNFKMS